MVWFVKNPQKRKLSGMKQKYGSQSQREAQTQVRLTVSNNVTVSDVT
jgi:hypothetical protein